VGEVDQNRYCGTVLPSEDGELVAVSYWSTKAEENGVRLWKRNGAKLKEKKLADATGSFELSYTCGFNKDATILYCTTGDKLAAWDTATGERRADVELPIKNGTAVFDPERKRVIVISKNAIYQVTLK